MKIYLRWRSIPELASLPKEQRRELVRRSWFEVPRSGWSVAFMVLTVVLIALCNLALEDVLPGSRELGYLIGFPLGVARMLLSTWLGFLLYGQYYARNIRPWLREQVAGAGAGEVSGGDA